MKTLLRFAAVFLLASCFIASAQEKSQAPVQEELPKPDAPQSEMKAAVAQEFAKVGLTPPTISWVKVAFETGVKYTAADQIGVTNLACPPYGRAADWFATYVAWDSVTWHQVTNGAKPQQVYYNGASRWVVFNGSYPVYINDGQIFNQPATTTLSATLMLRYHCLDGTYAYFDDKNPQQVTIQPRIPVREVNIKPQSIKGGQDFAVQIILDSPAPPSNTRVYLQWQGDGIKLIGAGPCQDGVGPSDTAPCHIDVPAGQDTTSFAVHSITNPGRTRDVAVEAVTIGSKRTATVQITH